MDEGLVDLGRVLGRGEDELLASCVQGQRLGQRAGLVTEEAVRQQCREFLQLMSEALASGSGGEVTGRAWDETRRMLEDLSRSRAVAGFTPSQTALFVFSLKPPLFDRLRAAIPDDPGRLGTALSRTSELLDQLGLYTTEVYQKGREEVILRQQQEMLELSTPVVQLWDGVLALPLIGTLDSARTQVVMEGLL